MKVFKHDLINEVPFPPIGSHMRKIAYPERGTMELKEYGTCLFTLCPDCVTGGKHYKLDSYGSACPAKRGQKGNIMVFWEVVK